MTLSPSQYAIPSLLTQGEGNPIMAQNAKVYETARGKFYVQLYWKGKQWRRFHFNETWSSMPHRDMAERTAGAINADIDNKKKAFDTRQHFKTPGYAFQFDL